MIIHNERLRCIDFESFFEGTASLVLLADLVLLYLVSCCAIFIKIGNPATAASNNKLSPWADRGGGGGAQNGVFGMSKKAYTMDDFWR
jgi:hypothetical protein